MPYYYVNIVYLSKLTNRLETCGCYDMNEESVRKLVAEPFMKGEELWLIGRRIDPYYVEKINIFETKRSLKEIAEEEYRSTSSYHINLLVEDILKHEMGKSVTYSFITSAPRAKKTVQKRVSKNMFIVHGRDHKPMKELKEILYDFGLNPIVLHEKASGGLTLVEKLEKYSEDVGYAFVILTPDDIGGPKSKYYRNKPLMKIVEDMNERARQNVIFEMGYFWGLLKRKKVCCLLKGDVEKPSDIEGIVYIPFKESLKEVQLKIIKELTEAGYEIKM